MTAAAHILGLFTEHADTVEDHQDEPLPERVTRAEVEAHIEAGVVGWAVVHMTEDGSSGFVTGDGDTFPTVERAIEMGRNRPCCQVVALVPLHLLRGES